MADKEKTKSTEKAPKNDHIPPAEASEGASGGSKDKSGEGRLGFLASKFSSGKGSRSTSPKSRKRESDKLSDSSKHSTRTKSSPSPVKGLKKAMKEIWKSPGGKDSDEETVNLCEAEITERPETPPAPKEMDLGVASSSPATESMAQDWVTHKKSSSVSSVPSDYSSLPEDDCDITLDSPDDPPELEDDKQTEK